MPLTLSGPNPTRLPHKSLFTGLLVLAFALGLAFALLQPGPVHGATFAVTTTTDAVDSNPGAGICDSGGGDCTLRAAIQPDLSEWYVDCTDISNG